MYELWRVRVDDGDGKELYGDNYADIYAINRLHYKAASPVECDHVSSLSIQNININSIYSFTIVVAP